MRFNEFVHWSDGLFLQPHQMQEMQRSLIDYERAWRRAYVPYCFGVADFELDGEALTDGRVVIKRLSAIMPDGQEISIPGNGAVKPLTIPADKDMDKDSVVVYLAVPTWSEHEANLSENNSSKRLYSVREASVKDENTGDNEIIILKRFINAELTISKDDAKDCSLLPLLKLTYVSRVIAEPKFALTDYMPPYLFVTSDCPLMSMLSELVFQLRRRRDKIISDISERGYNPENIAGINAYAVLQLRTLNRYEARLDALLSTEKTSPFVFYMELRSLLGELAALQPLAKREQVSAYNHNNLMPVFKEIITNIRSLIMFEGYAGYTRVDFVQSGDFYEAFLKSDDVTGDKDYYIAIITSSTDANVVQSVESGDNFKLINIGSKNERIRGVKLEEMRYPPRFLPVISNALWFKVCRDESQAMWRDVVAERGIAIDLSMQMFPDFGASLFITSVISEASVNE